jgi:hypothetical protein
MSDEVTTGELARRLGELASAVTTGFATMNTRLENTPDWKDVQRVEDGIKARHDELQRRVQELDDTRKWFSRLIGSQLVTGAAGLAGAAVLAMKAGLL